MPAGKHLRVHEGDRVRAGDRLSEGPVNPHDILRIKGPRAVQEYLLNEVQEVYRLQGVKINDKHIGVIVRQMLQKVRVMDPGETEFLEGEHVDKQDFRDENERAKKKKQTPATSEPLLLGITKASLTTQSFISAASFQETTRVLTDAAIRGAKDDLLGLKENIIIGSPHSGGHRAVPVPGRGDRGDGASRGAGGAPGSDTNRCRASSRRSFADDGFSSAATTTCSRNVDITIRRPFGADGSTRTRPGSPPGTRFSS